MDPNLDFSESEQTKRILFPNASELLACSNPNLPKNVEDISRQFQKSFLKRLDGLDVATMTLPDFAKALIFTKQEKRLISSVVDSNQEAGEDATRWVQAEMDSANHLIKTLVGGQPSHYPDLDAPSFPNDAGQYTAHLAKCLSRLLRNGDDDGRTAMEDRFSVIADVHYRNDGGRLAENLAMQDDENKAALEYAAKVDFTERPYGAVVVVGHSPTKQEAQEGKKVSQMSIDKIERAVEMNRDFVLAPFFILCGGSVRPKMTRVNEARSMKEYLVERHGISGERILLDATSEHTYSNFMNAVLIANQMRMPIGTKLVAFMVPSRPGEGDQYKFTVNKLLKWADREVYPRIRNYFWMENGPEERSVTLKLIGSTRDFKARTLLWKDYGGGRK